MIGKRGQVFILTGPSGVGKTEISKKLLLNDNLNLKKVITCTTRAKRNGEIDGKDYFFLSREEFLGGIENNEFFEHAEVYGNFYGSKKKDVENLLNSGKNILFQIDPQGAENLKGIEAHCRVIFVKAENLAELKNRLVGRNLDSNDAIEKRLAVAQKEIDNSSKFDFMVTNYTNKIDEVVREISEIIAESSNNI